MEWSSMERGGRLGVVEMGVREGRGRRGAKMEERRYANITIVNY